MYELHRTTNVRASGLGKRYGDLWALRDLDLEAESGSVLGLLGHNGAGKTTTIRLLTTLAVPTTGTAQVAGHDVVAEPGKVRSQIGVASQAATVDGLMSGRSNLEMVGRLYHLPPEMARERADELLVRLGLEHAGDNLVKTYSGGMRRRLDLAAAIVASPPVLFLDEPTTGLDPAARRDLWELMRELVGNGATLVLTTQYLEEADALADHVIVLDHGQVAAAGSPPELKRRIGGERLDVVVTDGGDVIRAREALVRFADGPIDVEAGAGRLTMPLVEGVALMEVMRALDAVGVDAHDLSRREATLDDVFLTLTEQPRQEVAA
ncbi:MAG: ATP-binding cassette domain-containing protein [Solirubrobacterales bacterium]|nr:ATP-binding cassette domain-containing protein [Solirubrobacterales bacterium]